MMTWGLKKIAENLKNQEYKDKKVSTIKEDVQDEFKKIDKWWYRDDQEIWQAWMNIIDRYIWEMENQKLLVNWKENLYYKQAALKSFRESRSKLISDYNAAKGLKLTTSAENRRLINDVAQRIDNAENEALRQIKYYCNPRQEQTNAIEASKKWTDSQWREIEQKPMFQEVQWDDRTFSLEFTDRSDKIPIHEALKWLFKKNYIYKIDYSNCKNERIKNKMISLTWTGKCWIEFDEEKKTYLLKDKEWNVLPQRALIWNWVRLTRDKLITRDAWNRKKEQLSKLWNIDTSSEVDISPENDPKLKNYTKEIPDELKEKLKKLWNKEYRKFIIETEKRLNTILKEWKELWYELHTTPVSKLYVSSWLMEIKFVNDTAEKEVTIWKNKDILWKELYNLLDWNEDEYLEYLTKRVNSKRWEFEELTKRESLVDVKEDVKVKASERLTLFEKSTTLYWISLLRQFIENHRVTEWDSRADNGDNHLTWIIKEIRDLEYTLNEKWDVVKAEDLRKCIEESVKKLAKYWADYTHKWNIFEWIFRGVLLWTKNEQIESIRTLSNIEALLDKTESSFLTWEMVSWTVIVWGDWKPFMIWWIEVNDEEINKYFTNINKQLLTNIDYDPSWELIATEQIKNIDAIYEASKDVTGEKLVTKLVELWMIPPEWGNNKKIKEKCLNIAKELRTQAEVLENQSIFSTEKIKEQEKEEKLNLEMKDPKTDEDMKRLQAIEYLEAHPDEAEEIHKKTIRILKDACKYQWINNLIRNELAPIFVDKWGWAKWENAKIYNDIVWYWRFDLSDENAKTAWKITKEVVIMIAAVIVTQWVWNLLQASIEGINAVYWTTSIVSGATKAISMFDKLQKVRKVGKIATTTYRIWSLMLQWTAFNAATKLIRNPLEWKKLFDDININPLTRENIQTAAFLWVLSFAGKYTWKLFNKAWSTDIDVNFDKWLKYYAAKVWKPVWTFGAELTAMLAAEESMNFVFWHEVINPITWEITNEHSLSRPTNEEWWTMVGLILAMRVVKPLTWPKIKNKIQIYRDNFKRLFVRTPSWRPVPLNEAANNPDILTEWENWNTPEPVNNPTGSPEPTSNPAGTPKPTNNPTGTPKPTNSPTNTPDPANNPTGTPRPTNSPTNTPDPANNPTGTPRPTNSPTNAPEPANNPTNTPEPTNNPTGTPKPTNSPTNTPDPANNPAGTPKPWNKWPWEWDTTTIDPELTNESEARKAEEARKAKEAEEEAKKKAEKEAKKKAAEEAKKKAAEEARKAKEAEEIKKHESRAALATEIYKNRNANWINHVNTWYPKWTVTINWEKYNINYKKYKDIKKEYEKAMSEPDQRKRDSELAKVDAKFTDRLILDNGKIIKFVGEPEVAKNSFEELIKIKKYKWKIELKQIENTKDYIIKYKEWKEPKETKKKTQTKAEKKAAEEARKTEAERQAREEAERQAKEEAERQAREEAERQAKEEAERQAREEAERQAKEEAERQAKEEAERQATEEARRIEEDNLNYMQKILDRVVDLNKESYNCKLDIEKLKIDAERLKNRMWEVLWKYKTNEAEINEVTEKFTEIKNRYENILKKYENINNELGNNINKLEEFIQSWKVFDRTNQKTLNDIKNQQDEIMKETDYYRWNFWDLESISKTLKEISTWTIYGVTTRYNWTRLRDRQSMADDIQWYYNKGKATSEGINNRIRQSKDLLDKIIEKSVQN